MAENVGEGINYFLSVKSVYIDHLSTLRQWTNLKAAFDNDNIWVTNFTAEQIESVEVKSLPYKSIYYEKEGKLYSYGSLLPQRNLPALLSSPIEFALPITLGKLNHNYFGVDEEFSISIVPDPDPKMAGVMILPLNALLNYAETAPEIRLKNLEWAVLNNKNAIVFGTPLLPLNGKAFWVSKNMILPVGYNFDLEILVDVIDQKINSNCVDWIVWSSDSTYFRVPKDKIRPLSLSALRKTILAIKSNPENKENEG